MEATMQDGPSKSWGFVSGTEECPDQGTEAEKYAKYMARRDRALAKPSRHHFSTYPKDPTLPLSGSKPSAVSGTGKLKWRIELVDD